jgi:hypothetical protein
LQKSKGFHPAMAGQIRKGLQRKSFADLRSSSILIKLDSVRYPRRFVKVCMVRRLLQHKVCDIGAGDFSFDRLAVGERKAVPIHAGAVAVRECARADDCPFRLALLDAIFLKLMFRESLAQQERNKNVLVVEGKHVPAVTDADRR